MNSDLYHYIVSTRNNAFVTIHSGQSYLLKKVSFFSTFNVCSVCCPAIFASSVFSVRSICGWSSFLACISATNTR